MTASPGWHALNEADIEQFLRGLKRSGIEHRIKPSSHNITARELCFYEHGVLYRVMRRRPRQGEAVQWFFSNGDQFHRMDGTLAALNMANQRGQLVLDVDNAADFLKFALFFTMGRDLDMHIVETLSDLGLDANKTDETVLTELARVLQPVIATGLDESSQEFELQAYMLSAGVLYFTEFSMTSRGQVSMTYIDEAGIDLPEGIFVIPRIQLADMALPASAHLPGDDSSSVLSAAVEDASL